jgi:hypothetical protein
VVAVLRPEEVEIAFGHDRLSSRYIGAAIVDEVQFTGALERVRLKLLEPLTLIQHDTGVATGRIEAARTQADCRALALAPGDMVAIGARRLHLLPTPLSSFVLHADDAAKETQLLQDPVLATLASRMKTRVSSASACRNDSPGGVAVTAAGDLLRAVELLRAGANEALLLTGREHLPRNICIHWTSTAARGATLAVAASLLRHLPASAICVTAGDGGGRQAGLRELLDAHAEARAAHALETRTELLDGRQPEALTQYLATVDMPLLVLGSTDLDHVAALAGAVLRKAPETPVLLVYRMARA